jgi:prevent-host-death family protein
MAKVSASEARATLPELLNRVSDGEEITIVRHGQPVAVLVRPDRLRSRRAAAIIEEAKQLEDMLAAARNRPLSAAGSMTPERAEELIREIRADRDAGR